MGKQMKKVEIKSKQLIFDDFFKIEEAYLSHERFDGQMSQEVRRLNFERGDSAAAILMNRDTQRVILINQFRYPTYEKGPGWLTETVAGIVEPDETPAQTIRREVLEETGYEVSDFIHIATFYLSPGGSSERIFLYYGEVDNVDQVAGEGELNTEHEDIKIEEFTLPELQTALTSGQIVDAKTVIGLLWLQNKLREEG